VTTLGIGINTHGRGAEVTRALESIGTLNLAPDSVVVLANGDSDGTVPRLAKLGASLPFRLFVYYWPKNRGVWPGHSLVSDIIALGHDEVARLDGAENYGVINLTWKKFDLPADSEIESVEFPVDEAFYFSNTSESTITPHDALILLDDDASFLTPNALQQVADHWLAHPECGAVQSRLIEEGRRDEGDDIYQRCEWICAGVAIRSNVWRKIRPYPWWFFRSAGESVAAIRMLAEGSQCHYLPTWRVKHEPSQKTRPDAHFHGYSIRNRYLVAAMMQPHWRWPGYFAVHFLRSCARFATRAQKASPLTALTQALRLLPRAFAARRPELTQAWWLYREIGRKKRIVKPASED
jgi:GT2 family glycosyltransferase